MSMLRSFRTALACVTYFVCAHAAAAQQIWIEDAATLRAVDVAKSTVNAAAAIASPGRFSADSAGRLWVSGIDTLTHFSASGAQDVSVSQASLGLQGVTGLATDPFDGTVWIADSVRLVHVGLDGQVIGGQLLSEALSDLVVAPDQTLWVLGNKNALHYEVATAASGRLIESVALSGLPAVPTKLFVDALRKQLWLESGLALSRVDLGRGAARTDIVLTPSTAGLVFDPADGWAWILTGNTLVARDGTGAVTRRIDLPVAAASATLIAADPYGQSAWVQAKNSLARIDIASGETTWATLQNEGQVLGSAPGQFLPSTVISASGPSGQLSNASVTSLTLSLNTFCAGRACTAPAQFLSETLISGVLNGQPTGTAAVDAVHQTATFSLGAPASVLTSGRLTITATDPFGHASNQLTMQIASGRIVPGSMSSQTASMTAGSATSGVQTAMVPSIASSPIVQSVPLDSPTLSSSTSGAALGAGVAPGTPLQFELNVGQHHPAVRFSARSPGFDAFVTADEMVFVVTKLDKSASATAARILALAKRPTVQRVDAESADGNLQAVADDSKPQSSVVRIQFVGASPTSTVEGMDVSTSNSNYLVGKDQSEWRTNVTQFRRVGMHGVYNGIDVIYSGVTGSMEYDFVVAPGADPSVVRQRVVGADSITQASDGSLLVHTKSGDVRLPPPVLFQPAGGPGLLRRQVTGGFQLISGNEVGFRVGAYDNTRPLVIDPTVSYTASVSSTNSPITAIAVDSSGSAYVAGEVNSVTFTGGTTTSIGVTKKIYIQKLAANGASVLWTTFIGGSSSDTVSAIAVDSTGAVYATGAANSMDFPVTASAYQTQFTKTNYWDTSAFVAKLAPAGTTLSYATYLGHASSTGAGIAVDASGNAYVAGFTNASDFPVTSGAAGTSGYTFVTKFNATGSALTYSTLLAPQLQLTSLAIDTAGDAYVGGPIEDGAAIQSFPATTGALAAPTDNVGTGSVLFKLNPAGTQILDAAQLTGHVGCKIWLTSIKTDGAGIPYIGGEVAYCQSASLGLASAITPYLPDTDDWFDFAAKLHTDLSTYSSFFVLPGTGTSGTPIAVDSDGSVHLVGNGYFPGLPVANAIAGTPVTESDEDTQWNFVAKINPPGLGLVYLSAVDAANDLTTVIAVDSSKNVYVGGGRVVTKIAATGTLAAALHSSNDQAALGSSITLTAVVSGGTTPTGTVKFLDGTTTLATVTLASGSASFTTAVLALGAHSLTVAYSGDTHNTATNSQLLLETIFKPLTSVTTLSASTTTLAFGSNFTLTPTVTPSGTPILVPSGSITLLDGSAVLVADTVSSYGVIYAYPISGLAVGVHKITAVYGGNNEVAGSTSAVTTVTVTGPSPPTVALAVSPTQALYTPPTNYNIVVTPTATAPGATIASVQLQMAQGTGSFSVFNTVGTLTAPPYTFAQTGMLEGLYRYVAIVTDSLGNTTTSGTLQTLVHQGPTATWGTPAAGSTIVSSATATLTGGVTVYNPNPAAGGSTVDVEFLEGIVSMPGTIGAGAMGNTAGFSATYEYIPAGSHTMRAYAKDQYGLSSYSAPATFTVSQPTGTIPFIAAWSGIGSGQTVGASNFSLTVRALSHNAGSIYTFQLFEGGSLIQRYQSTFLFTQGSAPGVLYSFPITATAGQHTYVAIVSDQTGTSSSTGPLVVNAVATSVGPTVGIDSPTNGTQFAAGSTVTLSATAWPGSGPIQRMDYYNGSTLLTSVSNGNTGVTWPNVPAGIYTITVVATDTANRSTRSAPVTLYVGGPIFGAITSPSDGSTFTAPATINLTSSASTVSTATIAHVDYYVGATLAGTSTTAPYTFSPTGLAAGYYQYTAKIYDSAGNTTTTAPITIEVVTEATGGATTTTTTYPLTDVAGSPIVDTDVSGHVLWRESYKPFGDRTVNAKTAAINRIFFHGKASDPESGLSYFGARYYDPVIGRFMAPDPAGFQEGDIQSFGRYAYGGNNPYRYRDPDGHSPIDLIFLAVDVAKLGYAVYKGEGVGSALIDVGMSAAGVLIPIPGVGQAMKAARAIEHTAETVRGAEHSAETAAKFLEGCRCFVAGTPVATEHGTVPIEQITVGMLVMARDEATGITLIKPVAQVFHYEGREIFGMVLLDDKGKVSRLEVTDDHPFKVQGKGWISSRDLRPGMVLESLENKGIRVVHLQDLGRAQPTFNLEVADSHTFFVGEAAVLVHNTGGLCAVGKKVPNPWGKAGGPAHQAEVGRVAEDIESRNLTAEFEHRVLTPKGNKGSRYVDVVGKDAEGKVVEMHQIGRQTNAGNAISRERKALDDIQGATGTRPEFHPYN